MLKNTAKVSKGIQSKMKDFQQFNESKSLDRYEIPEDLKKMPMNPMQKLLGSNSVMLPSIDTV